MFDHLTARAGRIPEDWIAGQFAALDHTAGEMDVLAQRLAGGAHPGLRRQSPRTGCATPTPGRAKCRALEDRLSDTLHEKLMARFIDRRTSALMRGLHQQQEVLAGVAADGAVTVEGHYVGRLRGLRFDIAEGGSALEDRALRHAAARAVGPELARRLGALAADADDAFALCADGEITWNGEAAGRLAGGRPFAPRCRLYGEMGAETARERAPPPAGSLRRRRGQPPSCAPEGAGGRGRRRRTARPSPAASPTG